MELESRNLRELVYAIASKLDRDITNELLKEVEFHVLKHRLPLIKRHLDKHGMLPSIVQSFDVKLVKDDLPALCDVKDCYLLRSVEKIPTPIRHNTMFPFHYVGTLQGEAFQFSEPQKEYFLKYSPVTGNFKVYYYINGYLWVKNTRLLKYVNIKNIFENPFELAKFDNCANCGLDDHDFAMPQDLVPEVIINVLNDFRIQRPVELNEEVQQDAERERK